MKDPAEQWRQLAALYAEMGDTELRELRSSFDDLTELAQGVLRDELKKRALWDLPDSLEDESEDDAATPHSFEDLRLAGVLVREYDTAHEASLAVYVLDLAGIQAVMGESNGRFDLSLPFVKVAPENAEKAAALLDQPIPAGIRADHDAMRSLPDFEVPACPHCSWPEVLLDEVEPTNQWLCGECGHRWADPLPAKEL